MTHALTTDGLLNVFDITTVRKLLKLPIVQKNLSAYDYQMCLKLSSDDLNGFEVSHSQSLVSTGALLDFQILKTETIQNVSTYLNLPEVQKAYLNRYGHSFKALIDEISSLYNEGLFELTCHTLFARLDEINEKKIILHIQAAISTPLLTFTKALYEQDILLQEIASQICHQASKAQLYLSQMKANDQRYKKCILAIAFSVVKIGLSIVNASELIDIGQALSDLLSDSIEKMEAELPKVVTSIQTLVVSTHLRVLNDAERLLLSTSMPEDIRYHWDKYRAYIFHTANTMIKNILDQCLTSNAFFQCIIREAAFQHPFCSEDELLVESTEKAKSYINQIAQALLEQVDKIRYIRDIVLTQEAGQKIECYFRKIALINYTISHQKKGKPTWISKKLGHELSYYFPDVVFQKKWTPTQLSNIFFHHIKYSKRLISLEEYQSRKESAQVVLGIFRNSSNLKRSLYHCLEDKTVLISDELIKDLHQYNLLPDSTEDPDHHDQIATVRQSRYSFVRPKLSLFHFDKPSEGESSSQQPVKLLASRCLTT